jgi:hypothetical protein
MAGIDSKSFEQADETRTPDKTRVDVVRLGDTEVGRFTFAPGWRWSDCIKPVWWKASPVRSTTWDSSPPVAWASRLRTIFLAAVPALPQLREPAHPQLRTAVQMEGIP